MLAAGCGAGAQLEGLADGPESLLPGALGGSVPGRLPAAWAVVFGLSKPSRVELVGEVVQGQSSAGSTGQAAVCPPRDRRRWLAIHRADAEIAEDGVGRGFDACADRSLSNGEQLMSCFRGAAYSAAAVN